MERKWTKGPWEFRWETDDKRWGIITNSKGDIIANVNTQTGPDLSPLCPIVMPCVANANLMISAPDLYEALEEANNVIRGLAVCYLKTLPDGDERGFFPLYDRMKSALAKARGEA